ncbi:hypothetical protein D9757_013844 [Collybiopsis confluens]|uniref:HTH CENPB-type domain-containing protein n=1 Tax=Collybiopsis confluens TaxID=2823264 RepID=A0A8H5HUU2_9AGAR|nr:hypothetical protein D9757_013844 [Collybiopsis confluens]
MQKSDDKKSQRASEAKIALQKRAVEAYQEELARRNLGLPNRVGAKAICNRFTNLHRAETGQIIKLNHATIINHAKGKPTRAESNAARAWLTAGEIEAVIAYIIEVANQGFPLSHRRLKEHVDEILRGRLGDNFPVSGVGKKWTQRFVRKYSDRIYTTWSSPLDEKRGRAVNPHTNEAYFNLLRETILKHDISEENTYATDEIGVTEASGTRERVIGGRRKGPHYQQTGGGRENTTVIVTICADGTSTSPAVIFKGKGHCTNWGADKNPSEASVGYSKKGWTNGEIGVEWIKDFDRQTKAKAEGAARLLLVDGHNSHYTRGFLRYARENNIQVLCYPSHATHVYQGLDVVVFSVLKLRIRQERDAHRRSTGESLTKSNFLQIYGNAHLKAVTGETVKSAFRKTGVWPYNPSAITQDMMAPAKVTSIDSALPVIPATPVRVMAKMIWEIITVKDDLDSDSGEDDEWENEPESPSHQRSSQALPSIPEHPSEPSTSRTRDHSHTHPTTRPDPLLKVNEIIREAMEQLKALPLHSLVGKSPMPLVLNSASTIPKTSMSRSNFLSITPETNNEVQLLAALREAEAEIEYYRQRQMELQAANILNETHCKGLQRRLASREEKKKGRKGKGKKLMGSGLPVLLTGDEFYERVVEFEKETAEKEKEKEARRVNKDERAKAMEEHRQKVEARQKVIEARRAAWVQEKAAWLLEKQKWQAKKDKGLVKGRFGKPQPKLGPLPPAIPRPKMVVEGQNASDSEPDAENDDEGDESEVED